jgi:DNA-binding transcriptional ArsR family regulator
MAVKPSAVSEIAADMPVTRSAVSQHLRVLKEAGLVSETPDGTRRIYRLDPRGIAAVRDWLDGQWAVALEAFADFANEQIDEEIPELQSPHPLHGKNRFAPMIKKSPRASGANFRTKMCVVCFAYPDYGISFKFHDL